MNEQEIEKLITRIVREQLESVVLDILGDKKRRRRKPKEDRPGSFREKIVKK